MSKTKTTQKFHETARKAMASRSGAKTRKHREKMPACQGLSVHLKFPSPIKSQLPSSLLPSTSYTKEASKTTEELPSISGCVTLQLTEPRVSLGMFVMGEPDSVLCVQVLPCSDCCFSFFPFSASPPPPAPSHPLFEW